MKKRVKINKVFGCCNTECHECPFRCITEISNCLAMDFRHILLRFNILVREDDFCNVYELKEYHEVTIKEKL